MSAKKERLFFDFLTQDGEDCAYIAGQVCRWLRGGTTDCMVACSALHTGSTRQDRLAEQLLAAFITPIERRDLFALSCGAACFGRALALFPVQAGGLPGVSHRQKTADFIENCGAGAKNVLCGFANYKKYVILQKKIHTLSQTATRGLQMCAQGICAGGANGFYTALLPVAQAAKTLAVTSLEVLIANL